MNLLSLFSGIGGLDLGLERAGMTTVGHVERDPFCRSVLSRHWPTVPQHDDVITAPAWWASEERPRVDVVAGGFPCQPSSTAGLRKGIADDRWLWPAMADIIADLRPEWVVWENVPGLLTCGLDVVHADLVRLGYRHRVGRASACAVGAPHARKRLFGVAHAVGEGRSPRRNVAGSPRPTVGQQPHRFESAGGTRWSVEPDVHRVAYGVPRGMDRRRTLGNAVVPQVAEYIGRLVMAHAQAVAA